MTTRRTVDVLQREWVLAPSTVRPCLHCGKRPAAGNSAFCKQSCRSMNHRLKWQAAPDAVMGRLREWTEWIPPRTKVDELFRWLRDEAEDGATRRARLMDTLGLTWSVGEKRWTTK